MALKNLGFGLMRLPMTEGQIDLPQVCEMVDCFMEAGFSYFDTAYVYHGGLSEGIIRQAVTERYPRGSFQLADKMPVWEVKAPGDLPRIFDEQLKRLGTDYIDYYLLHSLGKEGLPGTEALGMWQFMQEKKRAGQVKNIGFSFHDKAAALDEILTAHPEVDFVQLQINYIDWESEQVESRKCYEVAEKHGVPVIVMEPVKGGTLASMRPEIEALFKAEAPDASPASWAVRFTASLPSVFMVLSGMGSIAQMKDNTGYMKDFKPLNDREQAIIRQVRERLNSTPTIPCTSCKYCVPGCPVQIPIPAIMETLNHYRVYGNRAECQARYRAAVNKTAGAGGCIACGACEQICPQHIEIIRTLEEARDLFEG